MNDEKISKLNEMLASRNGVEVDLAMKIIETHIATTKPTEVLLQKNQFYKVTRLLKGQPNFVLESSLRFEKRVKRPDYFNPTIRVSFLSFTCREIRVDSILGITPDVIFIPRKK